MPPRLAFEAKSLIQNKKITQEVFNKLRVWCSSQKLPFLSDEQLAAFLLSCNNVLEATQKTIFAYFKAKSGAPELFFNRSFDNDNVQQAMKACLMSICPVRTSANNAILIFRLEDTSYQAFVIENVLKLIVMIGESVILENPPDSLIVIIDLKGLGLMHITKLRVGPLRKFFYFVLEGYSCKIQQIHVLNTVYFIDKIMFILRPLMTKELYNKIKFHPTNMDMDNFHKKWVPADCLPEDYGGDLECLKVLSAQTYHIFRGMQQFYLDEEAQVKEYINLEEK